jgi:uncharacterized membrane protein YfbV (UPF0208 family)
MNLITGFRDSWDLLAFRWNMIRSRKTKIAIMAAFFLLALMVFGITSIGKTMRTIAANPIPQLGTQVRDFAVTYVSGFVEGNSNLAVTGVLGAIIGSVIIIPIVGYSFSSLTPSGDLVSVRKNDYHRLSDSIILQFLSSISIIQLISLTGLNSLLTIESDRPGIGIAFGWVIWLAVTLATVFVAWLFEYFYRKFGVKSKVIAISAIVAVAGLTALLFSEQIPTLFGLATAYDELIRGIDSFTLGQHVITLLTVLAVFGIIGMGISYVGSAALNLPELPKRTKARKVFAVSLGSKKSSIKQTSFLLNIIFRNVNIWKPLAIAVSFSFGTVILLNGSAQVLSSLVFVVPLIVSLSWGVNTFGILGGGVTWLSSLPGGKEDILKNIMKIQISLITTIFLFMLIPAVLIYHISWELVASFTIATAVSTMIMSRSALSKAVYFPERYRVHIKGENVLPPAKALNYLFRFIAGGGFVGLLTFWVGNTLIQLGILAVVGIWQALRFAQLEKQWDKKPEILENIIRSVGY